MSNWRDWIYVLPEEPAGGWKEVHRQVHRQFFRVAVARGMLSAKDREMWTRDGVQKDFSRKRVVRVSKNLRLIELARRRDEADRIMAGLGRMTVHQLAARFPAYSREFWKEYAQNGVKRGVLVLYPARKANEDAYEWKKEEG